jgi:uncharacterized protein
MYRRDFVLSTEEKNLITEKLTRLISGQDQVVFSFVFGSFSNDFDNNPFQDIDIGIYVKNMDPKTAVHYSLDLSQKLSKALRFPVDVRVVNDAPVPFLFHVIQGKLIVNKDDDITSGFMEHVIRRYLDMKPLLHHAAKEAFAS